MDAILEFLVTNKTIILIATGVLFLAMVGALYDKSRSNRFRFDPKRLKTNIDPNESGAETANAEDVTTDRKAGHLGNASSEDATKAVVSAPANIAGKTLADIAGGNGGKTIGDVTNTGPSTAPVETANNTGDVNTSIPTPVQTTNPADINSVK